MIFLILGFWFLLVVMHAYIRHEYQVTNWKLIAHIANRSESQAKMLLDLCEGDYHKYLRVEAIIKTKYCGIPGDRETLEALLSNPDHILEASVPFNATDPFKHITTETSRYYKK
jgi:hypothetical protein